MEKISVSFIVPVYRVEKYIKQCVDSILAYPGTDMEAILIDDGSPDQCPSICDAYARKDGRIRVLHQENAGVSAARNRGINEARGEWLYFVDSDDWIEAAEIKRLVGEGERYRADIVFTDGIEQYASGRERRLRLFSKGFQTTDRVTILQLQKSVLCHKYSPYFSAGADSAYPAPWSKLIRRALILQGKIYFDSYVRGVYDDGIFTLEVLERAERVMYTERAAYHYRILGDSLVHSYREDQLQRFALGCERIDSFADRQNKDGDFRQAEYCRRIAYLSSFLSSYFFHPKRGKGFRESVSELGRTLRRYPFEEAVRRAQYKRLERKHRYTLFCMRKKLYAGLYLYTCMKKVMRR